MLIHKKILLPCLAAIVCATAMDASAQMQAGATQLSQLNPTIPANVAARILKFDHPLGSQIRLHEGTHQQSAFPVHPIANDVGSVDGLDVSGYQGNVDWQTAWNNGARFAYTKATEGTYYTNDYFAQQYNGAYDVGMIRGAYHFATPNTTDGATQADYFVNNGGGWSGDGQTLPGMIDLEYNPYGDTCYDLSQGDMAAWINDFSNEYYARTGRWPVIYTSNSWWSQCVGTAGDFSNNSPLFVANYDSSPGQLPYNWGYYTFWQYSDSGTFPGDQDTFNGSYDRLQALSTNQ